MVVRSFKDFAVRLLSNVVTKCSIHSHEAVSIGNQLHLITM